MGELSDSIDNSNEPVKPSAHPPLFKTFADIALPETISLLTHLPRKSWIMHREEIGGGYSGSTIERITLQDGQKANQTYSFVLKHIDPSADWLMRVSGDTTCREIQFTQSLFWTQLPPVIWSPVIACAYENNSPGVLLMSDVQTRIFPADICYTKPDLSLVSRIIDGLATIHTVYWDNPALSHTSWLTASADALLMFTPERLASLGDDVPMYTKEMSAMWNHLWNLIDHNDAALLQHTLSNPTDVLAALDHVPATLAHGDAWLANFGECDGRLILLDWALTTAGPATFDSLWLANTWRELDPDWVLTQHRAALLKYGVTDVLDDTLWKLLADLGWIRALFMGVESFVRDVRGTGGPVSHTEALYRLRFWCSRAAYILSQRRW